MKRPRRPAKHIASKKTVKRIRKILKRKVPFRRSATGKILPPLDPDDWTPEEAAVFDIPKPPSGFAYQWAPFSRIEYMRSKGWSQVPFSRHPEMLQSTNFDGYIVYRDTALFQISAELAKAETHRLFEMARDQTRDFDEMLGKEPGREGRGFYILPGNFITDSVYDYYPDSRGPVDVQLTITLRVPARWCDTANALQLAHAEYARRRVLMSGHLLAADEITGVFSPFELTTKKVEI